MSNTEKTTSQKTELLKGGSAISPKLIKIMSAIALIVILFGLGFYVKDLKDENKNLKANPEKVQAKEVDRIVAKVGKLISLPEGTPSLATVSDASKLKDQPFFAKAKKDDFVLIFTESKQAILYREDDNKIINVAPLAIDDKNADISE